MEKGKEREEDSREGEATRANLPGTAATTSNSPSQTLQVSQTDTHTAANDMRKTL